MQVWWQTVSKIRNCHVQVKLTGSNNFKLQRCLLFFSLLLCTVSRYMSNYITLNTDFFLLKGLRLSCLAKKLLPHRWWFFQVTLISQLGQQYWNKSRTLDMMAAAIVHTKEKQSAHLPEVMWWLTLFVIHQLAMQNYEPQRT